MSWLREEETDTKIAAGEKAIERAMAYAGGNSSSPDFNYRLGLIEMTQKIQENVLTQLKYWLRRYEVKDGKWVPMKNDKDEPLPPLLTGEGIAYVIGAITPFISINLMNSNYSESEINNMELRMRINLRRHLIRKRREYGLKVYGQEILYMDVEQLVSNLCIEAKSTLNRALGGKERDHTGKVAEEKIVRMVGPDEKRKGLLGGNI